MEEAHVSPNMENIENESSEIKARKSYRLSFKKQVIEAARKTNISKASISYGVSRSCVRDWLKIRSKIGEVVNCSEGKTRRLEGGGRPVSDKEFDESLVKWIKNQREQKKRVSRRIIQLQAKAMATKENFVASNGWLQSFLKRHSLVMRRATTVCQKPPADYQDKIIDFLLYVEKKRKMTSYNYIYACDETAVYLDSSNSLTVEERGARQVSVRNTGHEKLHVTVMLTGRNDGFKCRPFVILPNKRPIPSIVEKYGKKLELSWRGRTFFNDPITADFLQQVLGSSLFGKRMLVWDSFRCHLSAETKRKLKELRIDTAVIPGGTTKFIQAPDVYWNAPFKAHIRRQYEDYMVHGQKSFTPSGNMRAPPMDIYLGWIINAWDALPSDLIVRSFRGCGLGPGLNGEDDDYIQCFKQDRELPGGLAMLKRKREEIEEDSICNLIAGVGVEDEKEEDNEEVDEADDSDMSLQFE
uniref:HTH CENPB-type domain-containing protein n=1 Tax=Caenorhabditis japonica TaxID=281687 RepID=A0A8R1DQJ4_CAEJA